MLPEVEYNQRGMASRSTSYIVVGVDQYGHELWRESAYTHAQILQQAFYLAKFIQKIAMGESDIPGFDDVYGLVIYELDWAGGGGMAIRSAPMEQWTLYGGWNPETEV